MGFFLFSSVMSCEEKVLFVAVMSCQELSDGWWSMIDDGWRMRKTAHKWKCPFRVRVRVQGSRLYVSAGWQLVHTQVLELCCLKFYMAVGVQRSSGIVDQVRLTISFPYCIHHALEHFSFLSRRFFRRWLVSEMKRHAGSLVNWCLYCQ